MATDLRCPNCGDNLGKDIENSALAYCGTCGQSDIFNERGETEYLTPQQLQKFRMLKSKRGSSARFIFRR